MAPNAYSQEEAYKQLWTWLTGGGANDPATTGPGSNDQARHVALTYTPVIDTSIYASGDCLGALTEITGAARVAGKGGVIRSVTVVDKTQAQRAAFDILLFSATVTTAADQAAFTISDADALKCVAVIPVLAGDYAAVWPGTPTNSIAYKPDLKTATFSGNLLLPYLCAATSLFVQLIVRGTPTYTAASDLVLRFDTFQD